MSGRRAVFLDRDGTINVNRPSLDSPEDLRLLPGASGAIRRLNQTALPVVVVTNQGGIALGYLDHASLETIHSRLTALLAEEGAHLDGIYVCPHHTEVGPCECRKPETGLFRQAAEDLDLQLAGSYFVGDMRRDVEPALALGGIPILVLTGYGEGEAQGLEGLSDPVIVCPSLVEAVDWILEREGRRVETL